MSKKGCEINTEPRFDRDKKKIERKDKELGKVVREKMEILKRYPQRGHKLRGKYRKELSYEVTKDYRIRYEIVEPCYLKLNRLGPHKNVYMR